MNRTGSGYALAGLLMIIAVAAVWWLTRPEIISCPGGPPIDKNMSQTMQQLTFDFQRCISFNRGNQKFIMENGVATVGTGTISYGASGGHHPTATTASADRFTFRATNYFNANEFPTVEISYELFPETVRDIKTVQTGRPLFVLKRKVMREGATPGVFDTTMDDKEWCHYVVSLNLEYYNANTLTYSQLDPSPCPPTDPLGDGDVGGAPKKNDTTEPLRIMGVRITLILVPNEREQEERIFVNEIPLPVDSSR